MLQLVISFLPMLAVIAAVFTVASKLKSSGRSLGKLLYDLDWCITNSPAQVAFFMFSVTVAIASGIIAGTFAQVATQLILSLDILFIISSLLLIKFHRLKAHSFASL